MNALGIANKKGHSEIVALLEAAGQTEGSGQTKDDL
jgi:hypothetical protein